MPPIAELINSIDGTLFSFGDLPKFNRVNTPEISELSLGGVKFHGHEIPGPMHILRVLKIAKKEYIGGGKCIQKLGSQLEPITWQGKLVPQGGFYNSSTQEQTVPELDPLARAAQLDLLTEQAQVIPLIYGKLSWDVIITEFDWDINHERDIDYSISLEPLRQTGSNTVRRDPDIESLEFKIRLQELSSFLAKLFSAVEESRIFLVLAAAEAGAIKNGKAAEIALATLVVSNAVFPQIPMISIANEVLRTAGLIKAVADAIR